MMEMCHLDANLEVALDFFGGRWRLWDYYNFLFIVVKICNLGIDLGGVLFIIRKVGLFQTVPHTY
jgi:hypothetical protein